MSNLKQNIITDSLKRFDDKYGSFELTEPIYKWAHDRLANFLTQELSLVMQKIEDSKEIGKGCIECGGPVMALCNKCSIVRFQTTI